MSESIFSRGFYSHLFHGRLRVKFKPNAKRKKHRAVVSGMHHEGAGMASVVGVKVIEGTRSRTDLQGVYTACVRIERGNVKGAKHSTFFPAEWTRERVLAAIREVYEQKPKELRPWGWAGWSSEGVYIYLLLDQEQKIVTAFPKRSYRKPALRRQDARRKRERYELFREQMQAGWDALKRDSSSALALSSVTLENVTRQVNTSAGASQLAHP
jgi:hypothetical protein